MDKFSNIKLRFSSLTLSLIAHMLLLVLGHATFAYSSVLPDQFYQSVLVELNPLRPKARLPVSQKIENLTVPKKTEIAKSNPNFSQRHSAGFKWNDREFKARQTRMDAKIDALRAQIKQMRESTAAKLDTELKGFELVSVGLESESWKDYLAKLRKKVLEKWYPLVLASEDELNQSEVRLDFFINARGGIEKYEIAEWKGSEKFRDLCLESFKRAMPFQLMQIVQELKKSSEPLKVSLFFYYQ